LNRAKLSGADLRRCYLRDANLRSSDLWRADLMEADLSYSNLDGADISRARLIQTNLKNSDLSNCRIYGTSVWNSDINEFTIQDNLILTKKSEQTITIDNLKFGQFIYMMINNKEISDMIDTVGKKIVLILGRFSDNGKKILYIIRDELKKRNYIPVLFDFDKPKSKTFIETVSTIAHLSRFVIADFTDARIVIQEVPHIINNVSVPIKPVFLKDTGNIPIMIYDISINHNSLLDIFYYSDIENLIDNFDNEILIPLENKALEMLQKKILLNPIK
jgi:hypothetical protein